MGRSIGQQRSVARSILALVALYALVAQTLLASAIPALAAPGLPDAVLCAHDPSQAADTAPADHSGHGLHASCCTAACPFSGALLPPEPTAATVAQARRFAAVEWQRLSAPDWNGRDQSPFSARGPPA